MGVYSDIDMPRPLFKKPSKLNISSTYSLCRKYSVARMNQLGLPTNDVIFECLRYILRVPVLASRYIRRDRHGIGGSDETVTENGAQAFNQECLKSTGRKRAET